MQCALANNCLALPPIPGRCPWKPEDVEPGTSLATLAGEWWQQRGLHPVYDCFPCQHIHSNFPVGDSAWCGQMVTPAGPVKAPCWNYTYSFDAFRTDGTLKHHGQSLRLPGDLPPGRPIEIFYTYQGTLHNETWYLVRAAPKYAVVAFCSYMLSWTNVGSIVWVRPGHELTAAEHREVRTLYRERFNMSYDTFCEVRHGEDECGGPGEGLSAPGRSRHKPWPVPTFQEVERLHAHLATTREVAL